MDTLPVFVKVKKMEAKGISSRRVATVPNLFQVSRFHSFADYRAGGVRFGSDSAAKYSSLGSGVQNCLACIANNEVALRYHLHVYCGTADRQMKDNVRCVRGCILLQPILALRIRPLLELEILRGR